MSENLGLRGIQKYPLVCIVIALLALPWASQAQQGTFFNERDDQYLLLGLKRAKVSFEASLAEYERQQELFEQELISEASLDRSEINYIEAEVNYQQQMLAVLFEAQYVTIQSAVKYQGEGTDNRIKLVIANAAAGGAEFDQLVEFEDELWKSLQPDVVHDVYVSLMDDDDTIIGLPYEVKVDELHYGEPVELDFTLLVDSDVVSVNIIYGNGSSRRLKVFLQKDASVNKAIIQPEQFSQEIELGGTTDYGMSIELFSGVSDTFKLEAVNLPAEINRYFLDAVSGNRLSQFQFTEGVNTRQIAMRLFLPERPTSLVNMDEPITFYAVSIPRERSEEIGDLRGRIMTPTELEALDIGYTALELVPRGIGEILVRAPQLFHTIEAGGTVQVGLEVVNEGTRRLDNVEVEVDSPFNWIERVEPELISTLEINQEGRIEVFITPPADIVPGRYEARVSTTSLTDDLPIRGEDKTITIQIAQQANVYGTLIILGLIIALVLGIVIFGIKLSRR
ncbi:MAG: NEW3 domain-containing protein [Gammaproteobacteria bacterium]|jgi:hypothetical protein|nr:NEW3 domain-containing protein [Gammaproteobacteria bacterium]HJO12760.1 NEW3 domain-containing protein [Gammaproteobacteria bacterium]